MKSSYPRNIGITAGIFIFLIIFLAIVNLYINIQLRNEFLAYDQNKVISIAALCAGYLDKYSSQAELYYLLRNLSSSFNLEHLIISDTLGNKIYDSWLIPLEYEIKVNKTNYQEYFKGLPKSEEIVQNGNNFLFLNTAPPFYVYASLNPTYSLLFDTIFKWHVFYITISLFFVGFLGIFLIRNLFLPMRYVAKVATELGVGMKKEDFVSKTFDEIFKKIKLKEATLVEFSSYIAHEFRNSIGAIIGLTRLVEKGKKPAAEIIKECRAMETLINRLLEYSKPIKPLVLAIDIKQLVDDAVTKASIPKRINFKKNFKGDVPNIKGDYDLLHDALTNLLKNSIEAFKEKGVIEVEVGTDGDFLSISVIDNGCGIDTQELDKIFSPFYSKKEEGMGLGLAYVKKIMELHNGRVEVESKKGKGSKFTLKFPLL